MSSRSTVRAVTKPATLHWVTLAAAAVFLLWVNRHQWFDVDEWAWVVDRGVLGGPERGLLDPHNEHWSTIPVLVWRALFTAFGVRTYTPYLLLVIAAHLVTAHLLWRVLLRVRVDALAATLAVIPFMVLGAGWENLIQAFQFSVIGPLALGLAALLVAPDRGQLGPRDVVVVAILVFALMWSGIAVTMVIIVGLFALLVRGWVAAAAMVAPPAVVYLFWYAGWGRDPGGRPADPLSVAIQKLPEFVWEGLTSAVDDVTGLVGIGAVVLVLLGVFVVLRAQPHDPGWARVIATASGAVIFLALTGIRRSSFGIETAGAARYVYIVAALLLPLAGLVLHRVVRRGPVGWVVLVALTGLVVGVQVSALNDKAEEWAEIEQEQKHRIMAAAELTRTTEEFLVETPVPDFSPDLTLPDIRRLDEQDKLPGNVEVTEADRLTLLAYVQVTLEVEPRLSRTEPLPPIDDVRGAVVTAGPDPGCVEVEPRSPDPGVTLRLSDPASIEIVPSGSGSLDVTLRANGASGRTRGLAVSGGVGGWLNVNVPQASVELVLPAAGVTRLCRVAAPTI